MGIVQCLFNLLYYVIGVRNTKKPPSKALIKTLMAKTVKGGSSEDKFYSDISSLVTLLVLSLKAGRQGFPLAAFIAT